MKGAYLLQLNVDENPSVIVQDLIKLPTEDQADAKQCMPDFPIYLMQRVEDRFQRHRELLESIDETPIKNLSLPSPKSQQVTNLLQALIFLKLSHTLSSGR